MSPARKGAIRVAAFYLAFFLGGFAFGILALLTHPIVFLLWVALVLSILPGVLAQRCPTCSRRILVHYWTPARAGWWPRYISKTDLCPNCKRDLTTGSDADLVSHDGA